MIGILGSLALLALPLSLTQAVYTEPPKCSEEGLFSPKPGDPATTPSKIFTYFAYENGASKNEPTVLIYPHSLPARFFCLQGPVSPWNKTLVWFCAEDQLQWPDCTDKHCVVRPRAGRYELTCGVPVDGRNDHDKDLCDVPFTIPREDLGAASARMVISFYPFLAMDTSEGVQTKIPSNTTIRITQAQLNDESFRNLFCAFGPAPGAGADAAHGTLYCTSNPSQVPACLQKFCSIDTVVLDQPPGSTVPGEKRFMFKCGFTLANHWSQDCLGGKAFAPRFGNSGSSIKYRHFGDGDLASPPKPADFDIQGDLITAEYGALPFTLFCLRAVSDIDVDGTAPWLCVYDIREWPQCVAKHCVFGEYDGFISSNCDVTNDSSNQLEPACEDNKWWVPTSGTMQNSSRHSFVYYPFGATAETKPATVTADAADAGTEHSCALAAAPDSKMTTAPHGTLYCGDPNSKDWIKCITSRCLIKLQDSGSSKAFVADCASNIETIGSGRKAGSS
ncbi:hypothetical protein BCR37DRAFT_20932 [Protomyces lactucae-debilis]|uniref:Uncharacterized protein n=1 Tax=Protomyces lactucae-debilis TaxID=2754530 RepID=A0A1Y2FF08_PROLT|nr:uncharacterized protein BCR37DRAFT_20932 [Protomyces lactucae-debilis]ORY81886.1 hypothetical protein BCR37DRAFT_20932 [Protomyces lactucae-debilis]